jgi:hypothetical protein
LGFASTAKPNPAHFALAKLENALHDRLFICTERGQPSQIPKALQEKFGIQKSVRPIM